MKVEFSSWLQDCAVATKIKLQVELFQLFFPCFTCYFNIQHKSTPYEKQNKTNKYNKKQTNKKQKQNKTNKQKRNKTKQTKTKTNTHKKQNETKNLSGCYI